MLAPGDNVVRRAGGCPPARGQVTGGAHNIFSKQGGTHLCTLGQCTLSSTRQGPPSQMLISEGSLAPLYSQPSTVHGAVIHLFPKWFLSTYPTAYTESLPSWRLFSWGWEEGERNDKQISKNNAC